MADELDEIPRTGIRDIGITFASIRAGMKYQLPCRKSFPGIRHLFQYGLEPHNIPADFDTVMVRPLPQHIEEMRKFLRSHGLQLSIKLPDPDRDSYFLRARYVWFYGDYQQTVTCVSVVVGFPAEHRRAMTKFKMWFGRPEDFNTRPW